MSEITVWLVEQGTIVVVMSLVIYWLQKRLVKSEDEKVGLANDVIKLTTLWENKATAMSEDDKEFKKEVIELLNDINHKVK